MSLTGVRLQDIAPDVAAFHLSSVARAEYTSHSVQASGLVRIISGQDFPRKSSTELEKIQLLKSISKLTSDLEIGFTKQREF